MLLFIVPGASGMGAEWWDAGSADRWIRRISITSIHLSGLLEAAVSFDAIQSKPRIPFHVYHGQSVPNISVSTRMNGYRLYRWIFIINTAAIYFDMNKEEIDG